MPPPYMEAIALWCKSNYSLGFPFGLMREEDIPKILSMQYPRKRIYEKYVISVLMSVI